MLEQSGYQATLQPVIEQKHIDIRTSFVKEHQEDGKIFIKFVKSM